MAPETVEKDTDCDRLIAGPEAPADGLGEIVADPEPEGDPAEEPGAPVETGFAMEVEALEGRLVVHCRSLPRPKQVTFGSLAVQTEAFFVELEQTEADGELAARTGATIGFCAGHWCCKCGTVDDGRERSLTGMMLCGISSVSEGRVKTYDDSVCGGNGHHVGIGINRDGGADKEVRGVFLVNGKVDASGSEMVIHHLMGLLVSLVHPIRGGPTVPDRLRFEAFKLSAVSNSTMYRFGMTSLGNQYQHLSSEQCADLVPDWTWGSSPSSVRPLTTIEHRSRSALVNRKDLIVPTIDGYEGYLTRGGKGEGKERGV
jgi:hypothetical protein